MDDILVHKVADDHYFICVNASNQDKDFAYIAAHKKFQCSRERQSRVRADRRARATVRARCSN